MKDALRYYLKTDGVKTVLGALMGLPSLFFCILFVHWFLGLDMGTWKKAFAPFAFAPLILWGLSIYFVACMWDAVIDWACE